MPGPGVLKMLQVAPSVGHGKLALMTSAIIKESPILLDAPQPALSPGGLRPARLVPVCATPRRVAAGRRARRLRRCSKKQQKFDASGKKKTDVLSPGKSRGGRRSPRVV